MRDPAHAPQYYDLGDTSPTGREDMFRDDMASLIAAALPSKGPCDSRVRSSQGCGARCRAT